MKYTLSEELFKQSYVDSNEKIRHKTGSRIKLFPYITNKAAEPITDLETITGRIISLIEGVQIPKIILVHNHPSGNSEPSNEDLIATKRIRECCELMGIQLLDHIVIGDGEYHSAMS